VTLLSTILLIALILLSLAFIMIFYFWHQDRKLRLDREKRRPVEVPDDIDFSEKDLFAKKAPGLRIGEKPTTGPAPAPAMQPAARKPAAYREDAAGWTGVALEQQEGPAMPDPEARAAVQMLQSAVAEIKAQMESTAAAVEKINRWLEQISKHVAGAQESRLRKLEERAGKTRDADVLHPTILKKFNETELLINQSLSEMGRLLNDFEQRMTSLETQLRR